MVSEVLSSADQVTFQERPCDYVLRILSNLYVHPKDRGTLFRPQVTVGMMKGLIRPAFMPFIRKILLLCAKIETNCCLKDKLSTIDVKGIGHLSDEKVNEFIDSFGIWLRDYMPPNWEFKARVFVMKNYYF